MEKKTITFYKLTDSIAKVITIQQKLHPNKYFGVLLLPTISSCILSFQKFKSVKLANNYICHLLCTALFINVPHI